MLSEHGPLLAGRVETPLYHPDSLAGIGVLRLRLPKSRAGCAQHDTRFFRQETLRDARNPGAPGLAVFETRDFAPINHHPVPFITMRTSFLFLFWLPCLGA